MLHQCKETSELLIVYTSAKMSTEQIHTSILWDVLVVLYNVHIELICTLNICPSVIFLGYFIYNL